MIHSALRAAKVAFFGAAVLLTAGLTSASAVTITFDDVDPSPQVLVPNGYNGLNWSNFSTMDAVASGATNSGYGIANTSGAWSAFNIGGNPAEISSTGFNLIGGNFTAAWNDGLQLQVDAYNGATLLHSTTLNLSTTSVLAAVFNWTNLTRVVFTSSGGTPNPTFAGGGNGVHFAVDDLQVAATPIPGSLLLLLTGVGTIGAVGYTRRQRATVAARA